MEEKKYTSLIRLRMSAKDAHYGGNLVDGAHMVHLFGDVATELLVQTDIATRPDINASAADVLEEPVIVAVAEGTCVVPKEFSRKKP